MKHMKYMAIGTLLLLGVSGAAAQSLGDYARAVRKNKAEPSSTSRHYDNDNLPTTDHLSVVGPAPAADSNAAPESGNSSSEPAARVTGVDPAKAAAAERQRTADEWKKKFETQQEKIDTLNRELDLDQREYRLRAAAEYSDAGNRLRNVAQWDKEDAQYKTDIDAKQKALNAARQDMEQMQEESRKAGIVEKDKEKDAEQDKEKDAEKETAKDKQ